MEQEKKEQKIDFDFILSKRTAEYSDGDIMILDKIGVTPIEGTIKLDMIIMMYVAKGRIQGDINGQTYNAAAGDVLVCLPDQFLDNYMMSPDFESKIVGLSYKAAQQSLQINNDVLSTLTYIAKNPVIHLDDERQALMLKYYTIIAHKVNYPHGYYHKEIMHSIFQCAFYELCAIIAPHVQYADNGGNIKQANLLFSRFIKMLSANNGRVRSVKKYAEAMCITPKYLSFISKNVSGKTALEWIHQSTTETIVRYLRNSNMSIKEIADTLNFPNLSFFGKFTKSQLGMSPTEYRRQQSMNRK